MVYAAWVADELYHFTVPDGETIRSIRLSCSRLTFDGSLLWQLRSDAYRR